MSSAPGASTALERGLAAFDKNQWDQAIPYLTAALNEDLDQYDVASKLGFALSRRGRYGEAVQIYDWLHHRQPEIAKWPYSVGYQYYAQEDWRGALEWFNKALSIHPDYMVVLYRKGYALSKLGRDDECIETLMGYVACRRRLDPEGRKRHRKNYGKVCYTLGKAFMNKGMTRKAEKPLIGAVNVDGSDAFRRYQLGKCYLANGKYDEAIEELENANRLKPGTDFIIDRLAQVYARKRNFEKAEQLYLSIPERTRRGYVWKNFGQLYLDQGRTARAVDCLKRAVFKDGDDHNAHFLHGRALEACGDRKQALKAYELACYTRQHKYDRGFPEAQQAKNGLLTELVGVEELDGYQVGCISELNDSRGFGFILSDGVRIFFHKSVVEGVPQEGSIVALLWKEADKGPRAKEVRVLELDTA